MRKYPDLVVPKSIATIAAYLAATSSSGAMWWYLGGTTNKPSLSPFTPFTRRLALA